MKLQKRALAMLVLGMAVQFVSAQSGFVSLTHVNLINGTGAAAEKDVHILLEADHIVRIDKHELPDPPGTRTVDLSGKTIMPLLICAHAHLGVLKGTTVEAPNYTRENLLAQLNKYARYGVGSVLCMGTDQQMIFHGFRDSSRAGLLPGARLYSAGFGFSTPGGPPGGSWTENLFRPANITEEIKDVDLLAAMKPDMVKMWVDDFGGHSEKMKPEIYTGIIRDAHRHGLRTAAHLYYLEDARKLVVAGLDVIAHSIRDKEIDDDLLMMMKQKGVVYIPTLTRDEFTYVYASDPGWLNDPFFRASLEPGVYEMISSKSYQDRVRNSADYKTNMRGVEIAMKNLKKIYDAGILVVLGTDSGAEPVRAQGFSEHQELELMVEAGLTPLQAICVGTKNAAQGLKIDNQYGTLAPGKKADFMVLSESPEFDIKNSRKIESVWKNGVEINKGPLANQH